MLDGAVFRCFEKEAINVRDAWCGVFCAQSKPAYSQWLLWPSAAVDVDFLEIPQTDERA
jgi:hypothetical protein